MATHGSNIDGMTGEEAYWTGYWNRIFLAIREEATGMTAAEIERREMAAKARYDQTSDDEDYYRWQEWYGISYVMQDDGMDCYDPAKDGRPL